MKLKNLTLILVFVLIQCSLIAQPRVRVEWTDENGTFICDQSDPTCNCVTVLPVVFGSLEVLLEKEFTISISNSGSGFLAIEEPIVSSSPNWTITYSETFPVSLNSSAAPLEINARFSPISTSSLGGDNASITMHTFAEVLSCFEDVDTGTATELDLGFSLNGTVTKTSINYSIVLDRSGSMQIMEADGLGGFKRRIDLVSEAADYFLGLEYLRVEDLTSGFPGDKIGIVKYNNSVDGTYLPLSTATNTLLSDAQTNLVSTAATNDIAFIRPQGSTATGNAVIESINTHLTTVASGDEQNVIIMLSDGYENTGSLITDVGAGSVSDEITLRPDINIYSIGMGNANMASLEQYSNLSGLAAPQTFYYDPTLDPMALNSFFFKIYQNAIGLASVIDPTYYVNLVSEDWVDIAEATISSSDQQVTISITYPEEVSDLTDFRMIQPSGVTLAEGDIDGVNTVKVEGRNHIIYQVTFSSTADPTSYVGQWKLQGKSASEERSDIDLSNVPVGFAVASLSGLIIDVNAGTGDIQPGDEIVVTVEPEDSSNPDDEVEIEDLDVSITTPDGKEVGCPPERDPCGTYIVRYPYTHKKGIYEVYVKTTLRNSKGELTMRDAYQQVVVSKEKEILSSDTRPCLACKWIQILIVISIIILILLLILFIRKTKG